MILKVIIIFILILKMFSLIIGQLLVEEEYARINPILKRLESIQTTIDEIKFNYKYYNQTIIDENKNTRKKEKDFKNYRENIMSDWNFYKKFICILLCYYVNIFYNYFVFI